MMTIRVVIADDHPVVRQGLKTLLAGSPQITVVGEAADGETALELVAILRPDVLVLDVEMPGLNGIEVVERLHSHQLPVRVLIVTAHAHRDYIRRLFMLGVSGYLLKEEAPETIVQAVEAIALNRIGWFSKKAHSPFFDLDMAQPGWETLTYPEYEVLSRVVLGKQNNAIANDLGIGKKAVERHLTSIYRKLGVSSRIEAAVVAARHGLLKNHPPAPDE